jgi:pentatricopeptide repeat protein
MVGNKWSKRVPENTVILSSPRPRRPRNAKNKPTVDMDVLFQQIVHRKPTEDISSTETSNMLGLDMTLVQDIGKLQQMLDMNAPVAMGYNFLKTELYPGIRPNGAHIPQIFFSVVSNLMQKVISVKMHNMWAPDLPTVAEIFRVCADIGEMRPGQWIVLVSNLVDHLCKMSTSPADYPSVEEYEKQIALRDEVVMDLVESWKVLSLPKYMVVKPSADEHGIIDGFWFPRLDKFAVKRFARSNHFTLAFSSLFPQYPPVVLGSKLTVLAIATFLLLMDKTRSNVDARRSASRFMARVAHLISFVGINEKTLQKTMADTSPSTKSYIMEQWPEIQSHLKHVNQTYAQSAEWQEAIIVPKRTSDLPDAFFIGKRLSQAYGTRNSGEVDRIWEEFSSSKDKTEDGTPELRKYPHLFDSFLNTYMALNQPDKAIEVWNTLPKVGLRPTLKSWNVMLDGCRKARNVSGLKAVWNRLVFSGTKLDVAIWTTRIVALMESDEPKAGIDALEEMAALWKAGKQKEVNDAVQPTIEPVNAALSGLVRLQNTAGAQKLLAWAKVQGIKPDVITFNLLLRPAIREGRDNDVKAIFQTMKTLGVHADAATFTIVLDGTLTRVAAGDADKQLEVVAAVFKEMQAVGLETNLQTYGKMVYLLLRSGDRARESVKVVLAHLWGQGHELSPHIYTMLVEHYFSCHPPDLAAVDSLLRRRRHLDYDDMDRVFYDRVIKGYALVGDTNTALDIYRKLSATGLLVGLATQLELLKALFEAQRMDDARSMIEETIKKYQEQHGEGPWRGHAYWHLAARNGIADWVASPEGGGRAVLRE